MKKYIIIQMSDGNDLYKYIYKTIEEAHAHLEREEWKAYLIIVDGTFKIEDHT